MDKYERADAHTARTERMEEILDRSADKFLGLLEDILEGRKRVVVRTGSANDEMGGMIYRLELEDIRQNPGTRDFDLARTSEPGTPHAVWDDGSCMACGASAGQAHGDMCPVLLAAQGLAPAPVETPPAAETPILGRSAPCDVCGRPGRFLRVSGFEQVVALCDEHVGERLILDDGRGNGEVEPEDIPLAPCQFETPGEKPQDPASICGEPGFTCVEDGKGGYESRCLRHAPSDSIF